MAHSKSRAVALVLLACGMVAPVVARAEPMAPQHLSDVNDAPVLRAGDHWTYAHVWEKGGTVRRPARTEITVQRDERLSWPCTGLIVTRRELDSDRAPDQWGIGADWGRWRIAGNQRQDLDRPLAFPLYPGETWEIEHWTPDPDSMGYDREGVHHHYAVAGWEDVTVAAGRFFAVKIEVTGKWLATPPAGSVGQGPRPTGAPAPKTAWQAPSSVTGQLYRAYWYVPEVKRWVKQIEVYYDANGAELERHTAQLQDYRVSF